MAVMLLSDGSEADDEPPLDGGGGGGGRELATLFAVGFGLAAGEQPVAVTTIKSQPSSTFTKRKQANSCDMAMPPKQARQNPARLSAMCGTLATIRVRFVAFELNKLGGVVRAFPLF